MLIADVMTKPVCVLQPDDSVQLAAQEMRRHNVGAIPVGRHDELAGIITDRDIAIGCVAGGHRPEDCRIQEHMTAQPLTIHSGATAEEAIERMGREQVRRLCVVDDGHLQGMISLGDLAVRMSRQPAIAEALAQISSGVRSPITSVA